MSFRAKRELLVQVAPRYRAARHGQRSVILDEFVAVTGYDRKYLVSISDEHDKLRACVQRASQIV
ncbi:MAG: hypothetical protein M3069_06865, partial [Chloroflexota bacterium]|nr:hypothetical protein [Chloroflexota bacterium]